MRQVDLPEHSLHGLVDAAGQRREARATTRSTAAAQATARSLMPIKLCTSPRCPRQARPGASMCDQHEREYERERSRRRRGGLKRGPANIAHRDVERR